MLREILDSQNDIREQTDTEANTLETESNDDYCLIENLDQLQKVLDETSLDKALAFTQKVNSTIKRIWQRKHSETPYPHSSITDSNIEDD
jgi:hypothetical protein